MPILGSAPRRRWVGALVCIFVRFAIWCGSFRGNGASQPVGSGSGERAPDSYSPPPARFLPDFDRAAQYIDRYAGRFSRFQGTFSPSRLSDRLALISVRSARQENAPPGQNLIASSTPLSVKEDSHAM